MRVQVPDSVGGQYSPSRPPGATFSGTGLPELAQGVGRLVDQGLKIRQEAARNDAQDALNAFREEKRTLLYDPDTGYYTTRGREAYEKVPEVTESLQTLRDKYAGQLGTGYSRDLFTERADADVTQALGSIDQHGIAGNQQWQQTVARGAQDGAVADAVFLGSQTAVPSVDGGPPENRLAERWRDGRAAVIDELRSKGLVDSSVRDAILQGKDIPADSTVAQSLRSFDSRYFAAAISAQVDQDLPTAEHLMSQYGGYLRGQQYDAVVKQIKAKKDAVYIETTASDLVTGADSPSAALAATKDVPAEYRARVRGQVSSLLSLQRNAQQMSQAKAFEELEKVRRENPSWSADVLQAKYPALWDQLSAPLQDKLAHYETTHTNWGVYQKYVEMTPAQLKNAPLDPLLMYLAPAERKQVMGWIDKAKQGTLSGDDGWAGIRSPLRVATDRAAALYPLPSGANEKTKAEVAGKRDAYISLVQSRVRQLLDSDKKPTAEEVSTAADDITRQVMTDAPGAWNALGRGLGWWGDQKVPVSATAGFSAAQLTSARKVFQNVTSVPVTSDNLNFVAGDKMPDDVREVIDDHLTSMGAAITPENEYTLYFKLQGAK